MKFNLMMATAAVVFALGFAGCEQSSADETVSPATETAAPETTGQTSKDTTVSDTSNAAAASYELHVSGMSCSNCSNHVTELLANMDGVDAATVDLKTGKADVKMKPGKTFDEKAAHALIDKDYKLESCTLITETN